ncbi:hypothetical protein ACYKDZ_18505 [Stutzerimonas stutzeri]
MKLLRYFVTDDGSLPQLEVRYSNPNKVSKAFEFLFANNARDVTAGGGIANCTLPDLGVLVMPSSLNIDYRMGSAWGASEVNALPILLKELCGLGGTLVAPWWGAEGEHEFTEALRRA